MCHPNCSWIGVTRTLDLNYFWGYHKLLLFHVSPMAYMIMNSVSFSHYKIISASQRWELGPPLWSMALPFQKPVCTSQATTVSCFTFRFALEAYVVCFWFKFLLTNIHMSLSSFWKIYTPTCLPIIYIWYPIWPKLSLLINTELWSSRFSQGPFVSWNWSFLGILSKILLIVIKIEKTKGEDPQMVIR